jgi:S1-C subfamily serine protease
MLAVIFLKYDSMKIVLTISLLLIYSTLLSQEFRDKVNITNYFDSQSNLDPIEGIWTLNVVRTLYFNNEIVGTETEEILSEWTVVRENKLRFKVVDIGEKSKEDDGEFYAYFESTSIDGLYTYKCLFTKPDWTAKCNAQLSNNSIIEYEYFASEVYMKDAYKKTYRKGLNLKWDFIWTKKYPIIMNYNQIENSKNEWKGNGTGFFINNAGYIATNFHVIEEANEIEVEFLRNGQKQNFKVKVVNSDKLNDLSILKIEDDHFNPFSQLPYNFQTSVVDVGTNVFALGYPMALSVLGTEIKFTDGRISSKTGFQGDISTYQTTTPIQPGNSGGPLFDFNGNLVGINSAIIRPDLADNVSYSIKTTYLKNLIDVLPVTLELPTDKSLSNKLLTEKIKILSDYVVLIKVK